MSTQAQHDGEQPGTLKEQQRAALWTWRWLGWRRSTPAFKASLFLLGAITLALSAYWMLVVNS